MKNFRWWLFAGLLIILAVQVISCAPAPEGVVSGGQSKLTSEKSVGNWTYIPINRDRYDPEADLDVVSRWTDNNPRRELIAFQFTYRNGHAHFGEIDYTYGVYIYSRPATGR